MLVLRQPEVEVTWKHPAGRQEAVVESSQPHRGQEGCESGQGTEGGRCVDSSAREPGMCLTFRGQGWEHQEAGQRDLGPGMLLQKPKEGGISGKETEERMKLRKRAQALWTQRRAEST